MISLRAAKWMVYDRYGHVLWSTGQQPVGQGLGSVPVGGATMDEPDEAETLRWYEKEHEQHERVVEDVKAEAGEAAFEVGHRAALAVQREQREARTRGAAIDCPRHALLLLLHQTSRLAPLQRCANP